MDPKKGDKRRESREITARLVIPPKLGNNNMMAKHPYRDSLFVRLTAFAVTAGVAFCVIALLGLQNAGEKYMYGRGFFMKSVERYFTYVADDVGAEPDRDRFERVARDATSWLRVYWKNGEVWTTPGAEIDGAEIDRMVSEARGANVIEPFPVPMILHRHGNAYVFVSRRPPDLGITLFDFGVVVLILAAIPVIAFALIRRELLPLRKLHGALSEFSAGGDFEPLKVSGSREVLDLADNFNKMALAVRTNLRAREDLLRDVSHELRSPIARVRFLAESVDDGTLRKRIVDGLVEVESITNALLKRSAFEDQLAVDQLAPIDVSEIVKPIVESYRGMSPGVRLLGDPGAFVVSASTEALTTVFRNLIDNAIKYSRPDSGEILVELVREDHWVVVRITDCGIGLSETDLERVGSPFYRSAAVRTSGKRGFGLGLSLVKRIVDLLYGEIEFTSRFGEGTTVSVRLPFERTQAKERLGA